MDGGAMRIMSFTLTTPQMYAKTKRVTRRLGWLFLKPGDVVMAAEKCQGLKKGDHITRIGPIRILSTRGEGIGQITPEDVALEGFPEMNVPQFVRFFCDHNKVDPLTLVNRIEFEPLY